jgi:predicted ATP-dependent endonuclease of OLD family
MEKLILKFAYIQIIFDRLSNYCRKRYSKYIVDNKITLRCKVDDDFNTKLIVRTNTSATVISFKEAKEILPKFIYIGDISEKELSVDSLVNLFPINNIQYKTNIETYANQFIKRIYGQGITISINLKNNESGSYYVNIIDEYGNSNMFANKSSGVQQLAYLALFFSFNLLSTNENIILGLEEPESNLHTALQRKLFKYIRQEINRFSIQTFVTTHSPIFIDRSNPKSVFHVKRNSNNHTVVDKHGFRNNYLNIRQDLGLGISDSLFLGDINLVVEGPTEKILFTRIIDLLNDRGEINFRSDDVNILSAQGVSHAPFYTKLISETGLPTCVIVDDDQAGRNAKEKIEKDESLNNVKVIVLKREGLEESEVEDLIDDNILLESINQLYDESIGIERLNEARKNPYVQDKDLVDKFSKTFERLDIGVDKLNIAHKVRDNLNDNSDLSLIKYYFKEIDRFFANY